MDSAAAAAGAPVTSLRKEDGYRPSALARSLRIGPTKRVEIAKAERRAAVVLRPGMRQLEFRRVEARMERNHLTTCPVVVGANARLSSMPETPLCGLIVTGSDGIAHPSERAGLAELVRGALERGVPILAMSDAAELVLEAAGRAAPATPHQAVLINGAVHGLAARADIDRAIDMMAKGAPV